MIAEMFWRKVDKALDGCWLWQAGKNHYGYGWFRLDGKMVYAHRYSWELANGPIPAGLEVCHHCDTPACVNPAHLFVGTHSDNMRDCVRKGRCALSQANAHQRHPSGENHYRAKLTETQVREIRISPLSGREMASIYGVSPATIWAILCGETWKGV
jgi:hypothetical protein